MNGSDTRNDSSHHCILVVPCYNEELRICTNTYLSFLNNHPNIEFLFVDDGSTDATLQVLRSTQKCNDLRITVLELKSNLGKAEAVRSGLCEAIRRRPAFVGYWDADLSTPLEEAVSFLQLLEKRPDVDLVIGSRVKLLGRHISRRPVRHYLGRVFATLASFALGVPVYDTQCGAKIFRVTPALTEAIARPFASRWIFDVELLDRLLHSQAAFTNTVQIVEHPLMKWEDVKGSKLRGSDCLRALWELARIGWLSRRRSHRTKATSTSSPERVPRH